MRLCGPRSFFLALTCIVLLLSGCASTRHTQRELPCSVVRIADASYFALPQACEKEGIRWDYDALSKIIVLKKDDKTFRLLIDSNRMILNGRIYLLSAPVVLKDSIVYVSTDFFDFLKNPKEPGFQPAAFSEPVFLRQVNSVILDAGHGGKDPGAIGRFGLREKDVVLDVVKRLSRILEESGIKVYKTRYDDVFIPLSERSRIANEHEADLFISIHANANKSRWVEGFEVYYLTEGVDDDARALAASENAPLGQYEGMDSEVSYVKAILWDMIYTENRKESIELARYICDAVSQDLKLSMNGVRGAPFAVLKGAVMPAVLVEIGYISNKGGEKKLRNSAYREKMAQSLARGILNFRQYAQGEEKKK